MKKGFCLLLVSVLLLSLIPAVHAESSVEAELIRVCDGDNYERCVAVNADGTRFLIFQSIHPESNLWVQNADGSGRKDLFLSGISEEDAEFIAGLALMNSTKLKTEQVEKMLENKKKQYGNAAGALIHCIWQSPRAEFSSVAGDWVLLCDYSFGYARINMQTGETVLLYKAEAAMGPDGTVFCRSASEGKAWYLAPNETEPAENSALDLPGGILLNDACLLEDGTLWTLESDYGNIVEKDDRKYLVSSAAMVHRDADGRELSRIEGGSFDSQHSKPDRFLYSESTGIGILYGSTYANMSMWIFGPEDDTLKGLVPESLILPGFTAFHAVDRETAVDEFGSPLNQQWSMLPIGLSEDGKTVLMLDREGNRLLSVDIQALTANILMNGEEIAAVLNSKTNEPNPLGPANIQYMGFNGRDLLCGQGCPGGYVLRILIN